VVNPKVLTLMRHLALPLMLFGAYAVATSLIPFVYLPPLPAIWDAGVEWVRTSWQTDIIPSVRNLAVGYAFGSFIAVVLGLWLGRNPLLRATFEPIATFVRSIPPIALIPVFILTFGIGDLMRIRVIAVATFLPVLVNAIDGAAQIDQALDDLAQTNHLTGRDRVFSIILPGALPQILTGMKTSLIIAIIMIFTSELLGATNGIGAFILESQRIFDIPGLWAGTLFLTLLGFVLSRLFDVAEERLLAWRL